MRFVDSKLSMSGLAGWLASLIYLATSRFDLWMWPVSIIIAAPRFSRGLWAILWPNCSVVAFPSFHSTSDTCHKKVTAVVNAITAFPFADPDLTSTTTRLRSFCGSGVEKRMWNNTCQTPLRLSVTLDSQAVSAIVKVMILVGFCSGIRSIRQAWATNSHYFITSGD
jgi:hypothetical protein